MSQVLKTSPVKWSSEGQRAGVIATLQCCTDVVAILATGAGKTMLAILSVMIDSRFTTVIVVPLKSLLFDYERKFTQMGISYEVFSSTTSTLSGRHGLILVLIDQARKDEWKEAISKVHQSRPVKRMFIDEVHLMLTNNHFRQSLDNIYELRSLPCQFILLSGTIPPHTLPVLFDECGLAPNSIIIRTNTIILSSSHHYLPA